MAAIKSFVEVDYLFFAVRIMIKIRSIKCIKTVGVVDMIN